MKFITFFALPVGLVFHRAICQLFLVFIRTWKPHFSKYQQLSLAERLVSACHGVISTVVGLVIMSQCNGEILKQRSWLTNPFVIWFCSYLLHDTYLMARLHYISLTATDNQTRTRTIHPQKSLNNERPRDSNPCRPRDPPTFSHFFTSFIQSDPAMVIHHIVLPMLFVPVVLMYRRGLGDYFIGCFSLFEMVLPFTSLRDIFVQIGVGGAPYYLNAVLLVAIFILSRLCIFPLMYWKFSSYSNITFISVPSNIPVKCNIGCLIFIIMNSYFLYLILSTAKEELSGLVNNDKWESRPNIKDQTYKNKKFR